MTTAISMLRNFIARRKKYLPAYKRHIGRRGHDCMVVGFTTTYAAFSFCYQWITIFLHFEHQNLKISYRKWGNMVIHWQSKENLNNKTVNYVQGLIIVMIIWQLELHLPMQSVPITTKVVSSNLANGEVYSIQHYAITFVSDLWPGFLWVLRFPPPIKLIATINNITEITESGVEPHNPNP